MSDTEKDEDYKIFMLALRQAADAIDLADHAKAILLKNGKLVPDHGLYLDGLSREINMYADTIERFYEGKLTRENYRPPAKHMD